MYGEGISKIGDLLDIAANVDIVKNLVLGTTIKI